MKAFREELPSECPPESADEIAADRVVFRIVKTEPPTEDDFRSQRDLRPTASFIGVTECQARGLSVFSDRRDGEKVLKLPRMRGGLLARICLRSGAGFIQQTGRPSHHTWWPFADFDILAHCERADP